MAKRVSIVFILIFLIPVLVQAGGRWLHWDESVPYTDIHGNEVKATGYKVYVSNQPNIDPANSETYFRVIDVGNVTRYLVIACNETICAIVTAYRESGSESGAGEDEEAERVFGLCQPQPPLNVYFEDP